MLLQVLKKDSNLNVMGTQDSLQKEAGEHALTWHSVTRPPLLPAPPPPPPQLLPGSPPQGTF